MKNHKPPVVALLLAAPCAHLSAFVVADPTDSVSTSGIPFNADPSYTPFPHTFNLGFRSGGGSAVYLDNNWVLSAAHLGASSAFSFNSLDSSGNPLGLQSYGVIPGSETQLGDSDLILYQLQSGPNLPSVDLFCGSAIGQEVAMHGAGFTRGGYDAANNWYPWSAGQARGWGTNIIDGGGVDVNGNLLWIADFDDPLAAGSGATNYEAQAATGDSGGGWWIDNGGSWELAGIQFGIADPDPTGDPEDGRAEIGDISGATAIQPFKEEIAAIISVPEPSAAVLAFFTVGGFLFQRRRPVVQN